MIAANNQILQFCESVFRVIRFGIVFSQTLHETTNKYVILRKDSPFSNHYQIIIYKSFNYSNIQNDMLHLEFVNGSTNEL